MKITINLPEDVVEQLGGVDSAAKAVLLRTQALPDYKPGDRLVVLDAEDRRRLEVVLGKPLESAEELIQVVSRLAYAQVGGIHRPLTVSEASRIEAYATAHGLSPQHAAEQLLNPLIDTWLESL